ncbi:MAG: SDR family oxidoreductase [Thermoprotei archaeon]
MNVVIVTGASSGIGLATSKLLVENGFSVVLASRNVEKLRSLFSNEDVLIVKTDITKISDVKELISETISRYSKIDVLVNNAGIGISGPLYEMDYDQIEKVIATNLLGPIILTKEVLPIMIRNNGGCIVNVSSLAAFVPVPWMSIYAATKAALKILTDSWRIEFKPYNIRVIGVYPGYVKTGFSANTIRTPTAQKLISVDKNVGPILQPETVARKIADSIIKGANSDLYISLPYKVAHEIAVHMPGFVKWYSERLYKRMIKHLEKS